VGLIKRILKNNTFILQTEYILDILFSLVILLIAAQIDFFILNGFIPRWSFLIYIYQDSIHAVLIFSLVLSILFRYFGVSAFKNTKTSLALKIGVSLVIAVFGFLFILTIGQFYNNFVFYFIRSLFFLFILLFCGIGFYKKTFYTVYHKINKQYAIIIGNKKESQEYLRNLRLKGSLKNISKFLIFDSETTDTVKLLASYIGNLDDVYLLSTLNASKKSIISNYLNTESKVRVHFIDDFELTLIQTENKKTNLFKFLSKIIADVKQFKINLFKEHFNIFNKNQN